MIIERFKSSNLIIKEWNTKNIFFDIKYTNQRIKKINLITRNALESNLFFDKIGNDYYSVSEKIEASNYKDNSIEDLLKILANDIDFYHSENLIHGDIKYSNIVINKKNINLIDWEPILEYKLKGNTIYRSTMPFISSIDILRKRITKNTDKLAFYFLCIRLLNNYITCSRKQVIEIENKIINLNCQEIVNEAIINST
jgi:serine/threonine protein kinase